MMRLIRAEARRFSARRLTRLGLLGALGLVLLFSWAIWQSTNPPSETEIAQQQVYYEQAVKDWEIYGPAQLAECKEAVAAATPDPNGNWQGMTLADCENMKPSPEQYGWVAPSVSEIMGQIPVTTATTLGLIILVLAASYIGAEFSTGSLGNWLTFEPRRTRVFASKMAVVAGASLILGVAGNAILALLSWVITKANGGTMTWPPGTLTHTMHMFWRSTLLVMALGLLSASIAFLTRNTAAVIGVIIGWLIVVEGTLAGLVQRLQPYTLVTNLEAWITGSTSAYLSECSATGCNSVERTITWVHGGIEWGLVTVAAVALAWLIFERRDVT